MTLLKEGGSGDAVNLNHEFLDQGLKETPSMRTAVLDVIIQFIIRMELATNQVYMNLP